MTDDMKWFFSLFGALTVGFCVAFHHYDGAASVFVFLHLYLRGK